MGGTVGTEVSVWRAKFRVPAIAAGVWPVSALSISLLAPVAPRPLPRLPLRCFGGRLGSAASSAAAAAAATTAAVVGSDHTVGGAGGLLSPAKHPRGGCSKSGRWKRYE